MVSVKRKYKVSLLTLIRVGKITYEQACGQAPEARQSTKSKWKRAQELRDRGEMEWVKREGRV